YTSYILQVCISHVDCQQYLFFRCFGHPRPLHSFPTRRSSDLSNRMDRIKEFWNKVLEKRGTLLRQGSAKLDKLPPWPELVARGRSEEHTSELQSRENLVCRLLLEKKKEQNLTTEGINLHFGKN